MIGSPEKDAALRLECWRLGLQMAGVAFHDVDIVDKNATAVYNFIATGAEIATSTSVLKGRDKSKKTPTA